MTTLRFTVTEQDTALALGSGDVPVLATPRVLAWMEQATVVAAAPLLDSSSTSVGVEVWVRHRRASKVGARIEVEVTEVVEEDRGLAFAVLVREIRSPAPGGPQDVVEVASGRVVRAVVDRASFLARL